MKDIDRFMLKCRACMNEIHGLAEMSSIHEIKEINNEFIKITDILYIFTSLEVII